MILELLVTETINILSGIANQDLSTHPLIEEVKEEENVF